MEYKICPNCGHSLVVRYREGRDRKVCENCGFIYYKNPTPAAAVVLVENGRVLLVKRKYEPKAGFWSLPAGFVEYDETPEQAAVRETREETGIMTRITKLLGVTGSCEDHNSNIVLVIYKVEKISGSLTPGDDAIEAKYFRLDHLPENMAFSSHKMVLKEYMDNYL
ncbi:NUDIX hydrolase [candidate division KSB1 bacterium]|nr:NUDIX hydrolase [candidate division KSB1 bacterium]